MYSRSDRTAALRRQGGAKSKTMRRFSVFTPCRHSLFESVKVRDFDAGNIPHTGYVGVGIVTEPTQQAKDAIFDVKGEKVKMADLSLRGDYLYSTDDPESAEYVVKVQWLKTVRTSEAVKELGFFGNQNSVCRPLTEKWDFTVERLKKSWGIDT